MDTDERRAAKARLVEGMLWGVSWQEAVMASGLNLGRSGAYRVTWRACVYGEEALADHRHGHVSKMHAPVREWLEASCRAAPGTPSRVVQAALQDRFGLRVSVTHLNRLRASLGLSSRGGGGKEAVYPAREGTGLPSAGPRSDAWVDGAGGVLLLAGARETAVLTVLEQAVAATPALPGSRLTRLRPATRAGLLRTLLFLNVVGLRRPWDLRGYSGDGLAVLTGRRQAYGYRIVERFLRELATAGGAHTLTEALGRWTTQVWRPERPRVAGTPVLADKSVRTASHVIQRLDHHLTRAMRARRSQRSAPGNAATVHWLHESADGIVPPRRCITIRSCRRDKGSEQQAPLTALASSARCADD